MSKKSGQVPGYPYLSKRGASYRVRVQVPAPLKDAVGQGELIKSFGPDFARVKQSYHETIAAFLSQIEAARKVSATTSLGPNSAFKPNQSDIELACYAYFRRMAKSMRGKVAEPIGDLSRTRVNRAEGYRLMIENHLDAFESDAWEAMAIQADWLCEENGWLLSYGEPDFELLCRTMLRARLQCYRDELRRLEGKMSVDPDVDPLFAANPPLPGPVARTLGQLIDKFNEVREEGWSASTRKNYIIITRVLEDICGRQTPVKDIDRDFCRNVRAILTDLPANYQKFPSTKGKPIGDAIEIGAAMNLPKISPATVKSHLNKLGAIVRFGRDEGWIVGNPMANVEVHDPVHPSEKRDPFSIAHLEAIFSTEPWNGAPPLPSALRPSRYWVPLIALYSGARLTDICGQRLDEVIVEEGIPVFNFVHRPGVRRIKGGRSRKVPVHPELIALGFLEYVEAANRSGQQILFNDCKPDTLLKWGDATSKWFARKIKGIGVRGRSLTMHSFRHSFEDALRRAEIHDTPIGNAITGRSSAGVSKNYGSKYPVQQLQDAIAKVSYPGFHFVKGRGVNLRSNTNSKVL